MRCPSCGHERTSDLRCTACGSTFSQEALEQYERLTFLLKELSAWTRAGLIDETRRAAIAQRYLNSVKELEAILRPAAAPQPQAPATPAEAAPPAAVFAPRQQEPGHAVDILAPAVVRQPVAPPAPPRPRLTWEILWRALLSERLLEALLYLGAVLILAAAGTLVYFNWGRFSPVLQLLFLATGTASFFVFGWLLRTRWHLPQSGLAFIGIGALIIPVDFYAWARFRNLPPESFPAMWLAASIFCTGVYAATTWWLRARFFLVITQLAAYSLIAALLRLLSVPAAWWPAAIVAQAVGWMLLGPRLERAGRDLALASKMTAIAAAGVGLAIAVVAHRVEWRRLLLVTGPGGVWLRSVSATWWAGAVFFAVAHRQYAATWTPPVAALAPAIAAILTLLAAVPRAWVSLGILCLVPLYLIVAERFTGALSRWARTTGVALAIVAHAWALLDRQSAAAVYLAGAGLFTWWAVRFARPALIGAAQGAGLIGLLHLLLVARVAPRYWPLAIFAAAVVAVAAARATRAKVALARNFYLGACAEIWLALAAAVFLRPPRDVQVLLVGGTLAVAVYAAVLMHRRVDGALDGLISPLAPASVPIFQWAAALLAVVELILLWTWWREPIPHTLPAAGLVLATAFVLLGQRLGRLEPSYTRPWQFTGVVLSAAMLALVALLRDRIEVALTLALAAAGYALWARVLDDPRIAHLAAWTAVPAVAIVLPDALRAGLIPSREAFAWAFAALGALYLLVGVALDRRAPRFSGSAHLASHVLMPFALIWATQQAHVARWTLGAAIIFYAISAALAHTGRHPAFVAFVRRATRADREGATPLDAAFVYAAAALVPFWFHLAVPLVPGIGQIPSRIGAATAALAWGYLAVAWRAGRIGKHHVLPWRIVAQALAVVGGLQAAGDRPLLIAAVASGTALQVVFYRVTGHVAWVYTAALGGAGLEALALNALHLPGAQGGWALIVLGAAYLAIAEVPLRRSAAAQNAPGVIPPAAFALYAVTFLITVVGILLAALREPRDAAVAYALGGLIFLWAGRRLREALFGYPVAGLLAAAYVTALTAVFAPRGMPEARFGIWLAPGIAAFFLAGRLLQRRATVTGGAGLEDSWAAPMYGAAHVGIVFMMVLSSGDRAVFPASLAIGAAGYGLTALFWRSPLWLYPSLLAAHAAVFFGTLQAGLAPRHMPLAFVLLAVVLTGIGRRQEAAGQRMGAGGRPLRELPGAVPPAAQPWFAVALADIGLWELVAFIDPLVHVVTSVVFAVLAALLATWWQRRRAAGVALALVVVGFVEALRWREVPYPTALLASSLLALAAGIGWAVLRRAGRAELWQPGLRGLALALSAVTLVAAVLGVALNVHVQGGHGLVYTLSIVGLLYLLLAVVERREWMAYLGVAMLEAAWGLFLLKQLRVQEIQWYAIPAAFYILGVGSLERSQGRRALARLIDIAGLFLLFGSSFWQSLGPQGFPYAVLLAIEGLLVAWAGAAVHLRLHFLTGLGMVLVNVVVQAIDPLRALDKTVLFLGLGVLLVATAVVAERKREEIMRTTREWRSRLEAWE